MLKVPASISKVTTMSDGGLRLQVDTQELDVNDKATVMELHQKQGWFVFSDVGIKLEDIPTEALEFEDQKTLSERLRNVMYVYFTKKHGNDEGFEDWRRKSMEKLIQSYKDKID